MKLTSVNDKEKFDRYIDSAGFNLFCKYQQVIHNDAPDKLNERRVTHFTNSEVSENNETLKFMIYVNYVILLAFVLQMFRC